MAPPPRDIARHRARLPRHHGLPDATPGQAFDVIVHQAAAAIGTPMALVSLLDADRRWFGARLGIALADAPIPSSFCAQAIRGPGVLFVGDAARDRRFADDPLVTGRPHVRFYAGAALHLDGTRVGTLCVLDDQPRHALTPLQERYLVHLAERTAAALGAMRR